jgi:hypothetical protein
VIQTFVRIAKLIHIRVSAVLEWICQVKLMLGLLTGVTALGVELDLKRQVVVHIWAVQGANMSSVGVAWVQCQRIAIRLDSFALVCSIVNL